MPRVLCPDRMVSDPGRAPRAPRSRRIVALRDVPEGRALPAVDQSEAGHGVSVYIVLPQRYGPARVPSIRATCSRCTAPCWLSRRAVLTIEDAVLCVVCAMAVVKPGDQIDAAPWAMADLAEELGE